MSVRFPLAAMLVMTGISLAFADDWAQFRGPIGGVAADSSLPTDWAPDKALALDRLRVVPEKDGDSRLQNVARHLVACDNGRMMPG